MADSKPISCPECNNKTFSLHAGPLVATCNKCGANCPLEEVEQQRMQIVACGLAARPGGTQPPQLLPPGAYGWSPSYQAVVSLRRAYDALLLTNGRHDT